jgi:thiol-disulfide isomerase/thioredoxin
MAHFRKAWLVVLGCWLIPGLPASAQETKKAELLLSKAEELTADDGKDTKLKKSFAKSYSVKLAEGKAYRIDLNSKDFDTYLRLVDAAGKEVAFNDDISQTNLNSRLVYLATKTGDYRIIVTSYPPGKTGSFVLEMKPATEKETAEARLQARVNGFADSSKAEQKKLVAELTKSFQAKGEDVTFKDAQTAAQLFLMADDSDVAFLRDMGQSFVKIFGAASSKQVAGLKPFLEQQLKQLDKIGTKIEIAGMKTDGKDFDLKRFKGKVVLVDFWATWCGPCIQEIPNIQDAYKKYHGKGFEVIGISLDRKDDDEKLANFIEKNKLPWGCITIEDSAKLVDKYEVNAIPHPVLVGRDGRIVSLRARGPQLERLLERLLVEKK